jgi:hypothetical protein
MLSFTIVSLAVWRLSALFSYEDGPFDIFRRLREFIGIEHTARYPDGEEIMIPVKNFFLTELVHCVWCLSVWFAIIIVILYQLWPGETLLICMPFAISAAAIIIERIVRG